jgi:hypothetical protein
LLQTAPASSQPARGKRTQNPPFSLSQTEPNGDILHLLDYDARALLSLALQPLLLLLTRQCERQEGNNAEKQWKPSRVINTAAQQPPKEASPSLLDLLNYQAPSDPESGDCPCDLRGAFLFFFSEFRHLTTPKKGAAQRIFLEGIPQSSHISRKKQVEIAIFRP